jgi:hypothetical protein
MVVINGKASAQYKKFAAGGDIQHQAAFVADDRALPGAGGAATCDSNLVFSNLPIGDKGGVWESEALREWLDGRVVRLYCITRPEEWADCAGFFVNHIATNLVPGGTTPDWVTTRSSR